MLGPERIVPAHRSRCHSGNARRPQSEKVSWQETQSCTVTCMDNDLPNIGQEIRRLRKWRNMTLDALAGQAGISKGYLS